jgi:hypothetical protein
VQSTTRRRILRLFVRRALRAADAAKDRSTWQHDGGFSLDAGVRSEGHDRPGRERLLRSCARPPFARERIERSEQERILYHLPKPTPEGQIRLRLSPLERIGRLAALIPAPRRHRHRDSGVLAPNARRRPAVTAMACEARATGEAGTPANAEEDNETASRSPARYLWAMRLARLYAVFLLLCPACGDRCGSSRSSPIRRRCTRSWTTSASLPHRHRSPPPAPALRNPVPLGYQPEPSLVRAFAASSQLTLPEGTARRRPRRIRPGDSPRSILSPITTTTKAFPGDRRFLRAQTVRIPAAPVAPAVRDASACWAFSSHRTSVRWQIPPSGALWN